MRTCLHVDKAAICAQEAPIRVTDVAGADYHAWSVELTGPSRLVCSYDAPLTLQRIGGEERDSISVWIETDAPVVAVVNPCGHWSSSGLPIRHTGCAGPTCSRAGA